MFCQNCKATLPESAKFCTMCGAKINVSFCANGHVLEPGEADCTDADHHSRAASPFGTTMIMQEKEEESVGLLGWLVIIDGADRWRDFKITKRKTTIGRSRECDIVLEHDQVSAKHASIRLMDDGLYLTNLDSSNGTFVNDREVMIQKLSDNEIVRLGEVILKYKSF